MSYFEYCGTLPIWDTFFIITLANKEKVNPAELFKCFNEQELWRLL